MYKAMHQSMRDSEKLASLSDFAFRVWEMGCVASDLTGRITANPKRFWAQAMPMVAFNEAKYAAAIEELKGLVHFYEVDGKRYMVFHDHDEHNKGTKNLRNLRPSCPPPPSTLCYCIVYTKKEDGEGVPTADGTADASADSTAGVHVPVPVHVLVSDKRGVVGERRAANALAALWNDGPGEHLNGKSAIEKIQAAIDVGVDPQLIEQHFWDHTRIKGRKIWEVLDPLRPPPDNGSTWDDLLKEAAKADGRRVAK